MRWRRHGLRQHSRAGDMGNTIHDPSSVVSQTICLFNALIDNLAASCTDVPGGVTYGFPAVRMGIYTCKYGTGIATLRLTRDGTEHGADEDLSKRIRYPEKTQTRWTQFLVNVSTLATTWDDNVTSCNDRIMMCRASGERGHTRHGICWGFL